jgi:hypothetical protein
MRRVRSTAATRRERLRTRAAVVGLLVAPLAVLDGQSPTRDDYADFLPALPKIVAQTAASARLALFGDIRDTSYRDVAPIDGMDDVRARRLVALAERFSPILRRNNFSVPRAFESVLGAPPSLVVDTWSGGRRVGSRSIDVSRRAEHAATGRVAAPGAVDDDALSMLVREHHPLARESRFEDPQRITSEVLYFDFPGHDARSWRGAYRDLDRASSKIYAHPFLHEDPRSERPRRFRLVLQYWMFYPFNDGANNHEGDWEHINVSVTTREHAGDSGDVELRGLMDEPTLRRVLEESPLDSIVIASVDYYFHHHVMTLLYLGISRGDASRRGDARRTHVWEDRRFIEQAVALRLRAADGRLATHPIGYIGGDNLGPDELLTVRPRFRRAYNRNSGATYPFPATWQTVGPMGATENVRGDLVPRLHSERTAGSREREWHELVADDAFTVYRADDIVLLPDWERVADLVLQDPEARRQWSWLLLPLYWGFPVSASPAAGLLKHANLGHVAPVGPAYNDGWNRVGATQMYRSYQPYVLRTPVSPTTPWANVRNGWGFLNIPLAAAGLMPGYNVAVTQLMPWTTGTLKILGAPPPKTFSPGTLPPRFTSEGQGIFLQTGGRDFARLLPDAADRGSALAAHLPSSPDARTDAKSYRRDRSIGARLAFQLHLARRIAVENSFSWSTTEVRASVLEADGTSLGVLHGALTVQELTGGFRFAPIAFGGEAFQLYGRLGYGWTWYRLNDVAFGEVPIGDADVKGGYAPPLLPSRRWWPNSWYGGVGVEAFSPRDMWLFDRLGWGTRIEVAGLGHHLQSEEKGMDADATVQRLDLSAMLIFGW